MKKIAFLSTLSMALFLVACGDDNDTATNVPEDAPQEQKAGTADSNNTETSTSETNATESPFNFTHFSLSVDYANNQSYEVDYENESTGAEAKIEDELNNKLVQGNDAVDVLVPIFEKFTFSAGTPDDKIIEEILAAFSLAADYKEFELEVRFADGVEKEIQRFQ